MKKVFNYLFFTLFIFIACIPVFKMNTKYYSVSEIDNRVLAFEPDFRGKNYLSETESYLKDRIGYRNEMIRLYNWINNQVAHEMTHPTYTYGTDDYVFFQMHSNVVYNDFHKTFAYFLKDMQDYCESRGTKFYFAFEPEKISVYRDYLPKGVNYNDEWVNEFFQLLDQLGVHYIDNSSVLRDRAQNEQVFNVQYDAGHWNDLGCFYATSNIFSRIHQDFPVIKELDKNDYDISTTVAKYLPVSEYAVNETVPTFTLKTPYKDVTKNYSADLFLNPSYKHFHYYTNDNKDDLPRILTFQGSYYNSRPQFIVNQCREYIGVHNYYNVCDLDYYYNAFQPDIVLFEVAEYTVTNSYFPQKEMKGVDWNPALIDVRDSEAANKSLQQVIDSSTPGDEITLQFLDYNQLTKCYFQSDETYSAQYVYLIDGDQSYDLSLDSNGNYSGMLPVSIHRDNLKILMIHYGGERTIHNCQSRFSSFCSRVPILSTNVSSVNDITQYISNCKLQPKGGYLYRSGEAENKFSNVEIQLLDSVGGKYLRTIYSTSSKGTNSTKFRMHYPTGWYTIRMKANSNLHDEYLDYLMYLETGSWYYISFSLDDISSDQIVLSAFRAYGSDASRCVNDDTEIEFCYSSDTHVLNDNSIQFSNSVEGNAFSSVVLQLMNSQTNEVLDPISIANQPGIYHGYYGHEVESGQYRVWLRANSNIRDEYVECFITLNRHDLYEYSFEVVSIDEDSVVIKDFSFRKVAEATE